MIEDLQLIILFLVILLILPVVWQYGTNNHAIEVLCIASRVAATTHERTPLASKSPEEYSLLSQERALGENNASKIMIGST